METRGNMTEKEQKAIDWLKNATFFSARIYAPSILNLIEKQQEEIEELKKCYVINPRELEKEINKEWQDKIRAKIKEYDKWIEKGEYTESLEAQRYALNELLEE